MHGPAAQLAGDVAFLAPEVAESDGVRVHGVKAHEDVEEIVAEGDPILHGQLGTVGGVVGDDALDESHHVEGSIVYGGVFAESQYRWHGDACGSKGRHDLVLPGHVVSALQDAGERGASQDEGAVLVVRHLERQV